MNKFHKHVLWICLLFVQAFFGCQENGVRQEETKDRQDSYEARLDKARHLIRNQYCYLMDQKTGLRYLVRLKNSNSEFNDATLTVEPAKYLDPALTAGECFDELYSKPWPEGDTKTTTSSEKFVALESKRRTINSRLRNVRNRRFLDLVLKNNDQLTLINLRVSSILHPETNDRRLLEALVDYEFDLIVDSFETFDFQKQYGTWVSRFQSLHRSPPKFMVTWESYSGGDLDADLGKTLNQRDSIRFEHFLDQEARTILFKAGRLNVSRVYRDMKKAGFEGVEVNHLKLSR